jgi:hypothetical protein
MEAVQIIFLLIICALTALLGRNRKIGYGWGLFFCLIFSPLVGLIIILCSKKKKVEFIDEGGIS